MPRRSWKAPYLGKNKLNWCINDNIPILQTKICPNCGKETIKVDLTPPGDVKPAFKKEIDLIRKSVDETYGNGLGLLLFPDNRIVLINKIGGLDFIAEIIMDGKIYGLFLYDPIKKSYKFKPKLFSAEKIVQITKKGSIKLKKFIEISDDVIQFIISGKSILAPGVLNFDKTIEKDDQCIVVSNGNYITTAVSHADAESIEKMVKSGYGKIAKNIKKNICIKSMDSQKNTLDDPNSDKNTSWELVFSANYVHMQEIVSEAKNFILKTKNYYNKEVAVAYSGGKDSLCTLLLAFEVLGPTFYVFFANTGLEFPETIENTKKITDLLNLSDKLIIKNAGEKFWELIEDFGPPARDYRFCCHALKSQQIMDIIEDIAKGDKILSFLGQRRYESFSRRDEKRVYVNSFIPLQIAASPIKHWNALEVWLYILYYPHYVNEKLVKVPVNPLYFEGYTRLGCYLCPASSLSTFEIMKETHPDLLKKWNSWLHNYFKKFGFPPEWEKFGLWRYKKMPPIWRDQFKVLGIKLDFSNFTKNSNLNIAITKGFSPCIQLGGYSLKGKFNFTLDLSQLRKILTIIKGENEIFDEVGAVTIKTEEYGINIFADGSFFIRVNEKKYPYEKLMQKTIGIIVKSQRCSGCGVCEKICEKRIIKINHENETNNYPVILPEYYAECTHCAKCITHCPVFIQVKLQMESFGEFTNETDENY